MSRAKVLVVDKSEEFVDGLMGALDSDYAVVTAGTVQEALAHVDRSIPDIALLDHLQMPEGDGMFFCQSVAKTKQFPTFIVSGEVDMPTRIKLYDAGAEDIIQKSCSMVELKAKIRSRLRTVRKEQSSSGSDSVSHEGCVLNLARRELRWKSRSYRLSKIETNILYMLFSELTH